jgi:peptidoglycan/xylan/chitin deacetylase (PgdA/CDA1 family)
MKTVKIKTILYFCAAAIFLSSMLCIHQVYALDETVAKKVVYLTFDDGPVPIVTDKILDVLKKEKIKATFFVVGKEIQNREKILKRIHQEGHTIGLHTCTHNYKKLYQNTNVFIQEMLKEREMIQELLNITPTVIRFPGGSAGRMNHNLLHNLHKNEMTVFDWNVDVKDGICDGITVEQIVANATKLTPKQPRMIILAHTNYNNVNTAKALPEIIRYYRNMGYEFAPLTGDTKEYYYKIKGEPRPVQNIKK